MSSLIVEVCRVDSVEKHPNADRMTICSVKGWRVCAGLDQFRAGDPCVYIPPDSVLPVELSDRLGVTKYLSPLPMNAFGVRPPGGRVRVARLRGEASYGLIMGVDDPTLAVGTDVAGLFGITKFEPPPVAEDGDSEREHSAFHSYTDIENYRNFPDLLAPSDEVVFTEKLHGMNCRLGLIRDGDEWVFAAGSNNVRRRELDRSGRVSRFWAVFSEPAKELLRHLRDRASHGVLLFGELFGAGVQDMWYGLENGRFSFRAFDLAIDGKYLDYDEKVELFDRFGVERVPILYRGVFSREAVEAHVSGPTTMCPVEQAGKFSGREGIVITPTVERSCSVERKVFARVILKAINFEYLDRKGGTEYH